VKHWGRTVLAMDFVLAGAETQRGRPLNSVVGRLENGPCHFGGRINQQRERGSLCPLHG
jgi:hypothetical protein